MIRKSIATTPSRSTRSHPSPADARIRVTFELPSSTWACRVFVCGDFNNWSRDATPMRQDRDGVWRATVDLEPNRRYHFRYLIDGNWQSDYHADGWAESGYGSENSIVDTSILTDADPAMSGGLARRHPDSANIVEERQSVSSGFAPVIIIGEEHVLHSRRPVRQRTAVVRHTA